MRAAAARTSDDPFTPSDARRRDRGRARRPGAARRSARWRAGGRGVGRAAASAASVPASGAGGRSAAPGPKQSASSACVRCTPSPVTITGAAAVSPAQARASGSGADTDGSRARRGARPRGRAGPMPPPSPVAPPARRGSAPRTLRRITGTSPDANVTDTSDWLFEVLPSEDAYCGATPHRVASLLRQRRIIDYQKGVLAADQAVRFREQSRRQRRRCPKCPPRQNGGAGRSPLPRREPPSVGRSCDLPAQSDRQCNAGTSCAALDAIAPPETAQAIALAGKLDE